MTAERNEEPVDELGLTAAEMLVTLRLRSPEEQGVRAVVFLEDNARCMTALDGWDSDMDAVAAVFAHLAAIFETNGKKLMLVPIGQGMIDEPCQHSLPEGTTIDEVLPDG